MTPKEKVLLTIATVVKDDNPGLLRTLESVRSILCEHVEWLIVDSSLTQDLTRALLREESVTHRYAWVPPAGVYPAMNSALELARGSYIWFINAGDRIDSSQAVSEIVQILGNNPEWAFGQVRFVSQAGVSVVPTPLNYAAERATSFSRGRFPPHQGTIVRTEVLREIGGFDTTYRVAADYAVMLQLAQRSLPRQSDSVWAEFYEGGLSSSEWMRAAWEFHVARRRILHFTGTARLLEWVWTYTYVTKQSLGRMRRRLFDQRG